MRPDDGVRLQVPAYGSRHALGDAFGAHALFARLKLWTFHLPGLKARREDIAPNVDYELERNWSGRNDQVVFSADARRRYLKFATDPASDWSGNFLDLGASVARMRTLAPRGRITTSMASTE